MLKAWSPQRTPSPIKGHGNMGRTVPRDFTKLESPDKGGYRKRKTMMSDYFSPSPKRVANSTLSTGRKPLPAPRLVSALPHRVRINKQKADGTSRGETVSTPQTNHDTASNSLVAVPSLPTLDNLSISSPVTPVSFAADGLDVVPSTAPPLVEDIGEEIAFDYIEPFDTRGHFCDLFLGMHPKEGKVALKRLRHGGGGEADVENLTRHFKREATIWMGLRHKRILRCLGAFERNGHLYFASPFMKNGTLFDWIRTGEPTGKERLRIIHELSDALVYLHSSGIVHGDVKANNVLLSDDLHVQLCDFGLTKLAQSGTTTALKGAGSVRWQSPELWDNEPKTFASDVYAFSMTIVEVLTGQLPFANLSIDTAVIKAVLLRDERPVREPETSLDGVSYAYAWDVADRCWLKDANKRISMEKAFIGLEIDTQLTELRSKPSRGSLGPSDVSFQQTDESSFETSKIEATSYGKGLDRDAKFKAFIEQFRRIS